MSKTIYAFGFGKSDGSAGMKDTLGGKGANLAEMASLGLPVPPGVTIPTHFCNEYTAGSEAKRKALCIELADHVLDHYKQVVITKLGYMPLLSVRSGARVSMPGMMDTILNVGITSATLPVVAERIGERAALDSYRRLIQMYAGTVDGFPGEMFEEILSAEKKAAGVVSDSDLSVDSLVKVIDAYKALYSEALEQPFPDTIKDQLVGCIGAVFGSWMNERAIDYRAVHKIPADWGTAVTVQSMVFGNRDDQSATGVLFTRNPSTGEPGLFGEFLINAQGEDVVAGIRTPEPLEKMHAWNPAIYEQLVGFAEAMEAHYADMQDMEFTVESGKLYVLQTRNGKRGAVAAFRIAHDLWQAGKIDIKKALSRVTGKQYLALRRPAIDPSFKTAPTVVGLPAAGQIVTGKAVFSAEAAKAFKGDCILVTHETTPDDFAGMMASVGILTVTGGATSHAAVVARGMDKTCVVGATKLVLGKTVKDGDTVTIDGATGRVWVNVKVPVQTGSLTKEAKALIAAAPKDATDAALRVRITTDTVTKNLPESGNVVFDLSALDLSKQEHYAMARAVVTRLRWCPNLSGMIDFRPNLSEALGSAQDEKTLTFLGFGSTKPTAVVEKSKPLPMAEFSALFCTDKVFPKVKARWALGVTSKDAEKLAAENGWKMVMRAATLGDLLAAKGGFVEATANLKEVLKEQGTDLMTMMGLIGAQPVPKAVDEHEVVFAILSK